MKIPNTLQLSGTALLIIIIVSGPTGVLAAVKNGTWFDKIGKIYAFIGMCLPRFWVGLMLILVFAVNLKWLPVCGQGDWRNVLMPAFGLSLGFTAEFVRLIRSAMLDALDSEYIKMARIKGVPEFIVVVKHALRNALLPAVGHFGMSIIWLMTSSVVMEVIFAWPGVGLMTYQAILGRDFPLVQATVLIFGMGFVFVNILVDILYAYLDPRIRY
jgi:peptide/nickel transport system permease protein